MRIGHGYDVHKLVEGRKLIIGGVDIPHEKGLLGHSDADVLLHAIADSLLGAAALGDIGNKQDRPCTICPRRFGGYAPRLKTDAWRQAIYLHQLLHGRGHR